MTLDQPPVISPPDFDRDAPADTTEDLRTIIGRWQQRATTAENDRDAFRGLLERIFGPEMVEEWRTDGLPLPAVRADAPGTIVFEASVGGIVIKRNNSQGARLQCVLAASLAGAPVNDLAMLTEDTACEVRLVPLSYQATLDTLMQQRERDAIPPLPTPEPDPPDARPDEEEQRDPPPAVTNGANGAGDPRRRAPVANRRVRQR